MGLAPLTRRLPAPAPTPCAHHNGCRSLRGGGKAKAAWCRRHTRCKPRTLAVAQGQVATASARVEGVFGPLCQSPEPTVTLTRMKMLAVVAAILSLAQTALLPSPGAAQEPAIKRAQPGGGAAKSTPGGSARTKAITPHVPRINRMPRTTGPALRPPVSVRPPRGQQPTIRPPVAIKPPTTIRPPIVRSPPRARPPRHAHRRWRPGLRWRWLVVPSIILAEELAWCHYHAYEVSGMHFHRNIRCHMHSRWNHPALRYVEAY